MGAVDQRTRKNGIRLHTLRIGLRMRKDHSEGDKIQAVVPLRLTYMQRLHMELVIEHRRTMVRYSSAITRTATQILPVLLCNNSTIQF